jgi:hypothetical protein
MSTSVPFRSIVLAVLAPMLPILDHTKFMFPLPSPFWKFVLWFMVKELSGVHKSNVSVTTPERLMLRLALVTFCIFAP